MVITMVGFRTYVTVLEEKETRPARVFATTDLTGTAMLVLGADGLSGI